MEKLLFKAIVGSQSHGTSIPTSDIDYKGVYMQDVDALITFGYKEQYYVNKDECYFEVQRFLQLLQTANPTVLELLYSPKECILETSPQFELIVQNRDKFLTKQCLNSFAGYAIAQIKKAKGLDKKMNWKENRIVRKDVLDFCYFTVGDKSYPLKEIIDSGTHGVDINKFGLSKIDHFTDCYSLYYSPECAGLIKENSNEICLSPVPKDLKPIGIVFYNWREYSKHCSEYKEYQTWLKERNIHRYIDNVNHNQKIDGKNLMHCRRLLDMAIEIAKDGVLNVKRPNAEYLLSIRKGEINLEDLIKKAEEDIKSLDTLYANSKLPNHCDKQFVNDLLLQIRKL